MDDPVDFKILRAAVDEMNQKLRQQNQFVVHETAKLQESFEKRQARSKMFPVHRRPFWQRFRKDTFHDPLLNPEKNRTVSTAWHTAFTHEKKLFGENQTAARLRGAILRWRADQARKKYLSDVQQQLQTLLKNMRS